MKNKNFACSILKALSLALCLFTVLACLSACAGGSEEEKSGYSVITEGLTIKPDMAMSEVLDVLGSMYDYSESSACPPFEGTEKLYDFVHLQITTYADGDTDRVMSIFLKDDAVDVSGVKIGSTVAEMTAALGEKYTESSGGTYVYTAENGSVLKCIVKDSGIVSIRIITEKADT